jgi:aconitate hydratase
MLDYIFKTEFREFSVGYNIAEKIFNAHRVYGSTKAGETIGLNVNEVYTQDATGTMAWLQFEAIGIPRVKVPLAVSYVDHNTQQSDFMNADDHAFLESAAAKYGAWFSRPGNGISHQVNLERFSAPGWIALGTDSHTPTGGGMGMVAIGVGGLDAATVMAGTPFELKMPEIVQVWLSGNLNRPWVTAMDVILELLRRLTVKGGVGRIMEYGGSGVAGLSVPERATITNMVAELGATTSIFPSDQETLRFLKAQQREKDWTELKADRDAQYAETIEVDLSSIEPLTAQPHSPDRVIPVRELAGTKINQACIGSCTNSSYRMMNQAASILRGRTVKRGVSLLVNPGSKQVCEMLARDGSTADMIAAGARMYESSCGPCIGMGGSPGTNHISVRSYNRNFQGRCGNKNASVYLMNPLLCSLFAVRGEFTDPADTEIMVEEPDEVESFPINDNMLVPPVEDTSGLDIIKGPNIKDVPLKEPLFDNLEAEVLLKLGDNITTDDIMPAGSKILPLRSNIPAISEYVFAGIDSGFSSRAGRGEGFIVIGGDNYGQGSSREHAAIAPMYLGLQAVISKSFARIHRSNLINFGILPLEFKDKSDHERIEQGDILRIEDVRSYLRGVVGCMVRNVNKDYSFEVAANLNNREAELIEKGGLLAHTREKTRDPA